MRAIKKIPVFLLTMILCILCIGLMAMPAFAASSSQDGLEVTLTTDKESYSQSEQIVATLTVTNTNDFAVSNVSLENVIPEGYTLAEGNEATKQVESLAAGETTTLTVTYTAKSDSGYSGNGNGSGSSNRNSSSSTTTAASKDGKAASSSNTGDTSRMALWITLLLLACGGLVTLTALRKKSGKKLLSLFLCVAMVGSIVFGVTTSANAMELQTKSIIVSQHITIDNTDLEIRAIVKYDMDTVQDDEHAKKTYTVTFETNGGTEIERQIVELGSSVVQPENPAREGYVFYGWYKDQLLIEPFDFTSPIEEDITLYAKWVDANDNLNDSIIDLGDIQTMISDGTIEVIFDDNGDISSIDGSVSDDKINSPSDAVELLVSMSSLFDTDFEVSEDNISVRFTDDGDENFYCYTPKINGISVIGSQIIIATDCNGNITGLFSTYKPLVNNIDTDATINEDEARAIAEETLLAKDEINSFIDLYVSEDISREELDDIFLSLQSIDSNLVVYAASDTNIPALVYEIKIATKVNISDLDGAEEISEDLMPVEAVENEGELVLEETDSIDDEIDSAVEEAVTEEVVTEETDFDEASFSHDEETREVEAEKVEDISGEIEDLDNEEESYELPPLVSETFYIYANGDNAKDVYLVIDNNEDWSTVYVTSEDLNGVDREYVAQQDGNKYRLVDSIRNITTYESDDYIALNGPWYSTDSYYLESSLPGTIVESTRLFGTRMAKDAVSAHSNMEAVYDYYRNILSRNSFDGAGAKIKVTIHYKALVKNAFWSSDYQQMLYGSVGNLEAGLDVAGHEFTHAVINYVVGDGANRTLTYYGESGALNESYADIMGELIESKNGSDDWLLGEDTSNAGRSLADPSIYNQPEHYNNRYTGTSDNGGVHVNSGIFNFAAYKMMTDSRTSSISNSIWAKVFYRSLYRLSTDATFLEARGAVLSSAKALGFNGTQQQAIKDAFDAVGIKEPDSIRIVLTWGETPSDLDSHLVGPAVNGTGRFHVYYGSRNYYNDGSTSSGNSSYAVDLDYDDTTSYGPEITTIHTLTAGEYYFYVHDFSNGSSSTSTAMASSGATVKIYRGASNAASQEYHVSTSSSGTYWNVFKLTISSSGDLTFDEINTYGSSATYD